MKQKIVIKVAMRCDKCRSKAMSLVASTSGVDSVQIAGDAKDQVVVVGDGVDSVKLTSALRKKLGHAQLVQVADAAAAAAKKKEEDQKKIVAAENVPWPYHQYPPPPYMQPVPVGVVYDYEQQPGSACVIM